MLFGLSNEGGMLFFCFVETNEREAFLKYFILIKILAGI